MYSQSIWFHPHGSRNGKKAAGRLEFRLERARLKALSPEKRKNCPRTPCTKVSDDNADAVSIITAQLIFGFVILRVQRFNIDLKF